MHHSCFTRHRQRERHTSTFPHQAPDVFWPRLKKKSCRRNELVNNCLLVLTLVLTIIPFGSQQCLLRPISIRVYTRVGPVFPQGHVTHAHLTYGNTGNTPRSIPQTIPTNVETETHKHPGLPAGDYPGSPRRGLPAHASIPAGDQPHTPGTIPH